GVDLRDQLERTRSSASCLLRNDLGDGGQVVLALALDLSDDAGCEAARSPRKTRLGRCDNQIDRVTRTILRGDGLAHACVDENELAGLLEQLERLADRRGLVWPPHPGALLHDGLLLTVERGARNNAGRRIVDPHEDAFSDQLLELAEKRGLAGWFNRALRS